jgi:putative ABC transport system permease protein
VLRTERPPLGLMYAVRATIAQTNPQIAMRFTTMDTMVGRSIAVERFQSLLVSAFAAAGLLLAMLGVYGTMAHAVAQRRFEIGLRMAFGAERTGCSRWLLGRAGMLACWGIALGLAGSLLTAHLIAGMLVGVRPIDPISLGAATTMMLMTALVAALLPAQQAAGVNLMVALRNE